MNNKEVFTDIYDSKMWKSDIAGTLSGPGSDIECSYEYVEFLNKFINKHKIKSVLDLGCGDFNLMRHVNLKNIDYLGIDVVDCVIFQNKKTYPNLSFICDDIINFDTITKTFDLYIIKDILQHLSFDSIKKIIDKLPSNKYILVTNDIPPTPVTENIYCNNGEYHLIQLDKPPFNLILNHKLTFDSCGFLKRVDLYIK